MKVLYDGDELASIETDSPPLDKYSVPIIKSAKKKITFLKSAKDERDIRNWKSLHYEKLSGDREGQRSIRLNDTWRLVFTIRNDLDPPEITILHICNYH